MCRDESLSIFFLTTEAYIRESTFLPLHMKSCFVNIDPSKISLIMLPVLMETSGFKNENSDKYSINLFI